MTRMPVALSTLILTGLLFFTGAPGQADLWTPEALPFATDPGGGLGFALDSTGTPGFAFRTYTGSGDTTGLYYGYSSGGGWTSELIDADWGTGAGISLIYEDATAHISYGAGNVDLDLSYATGVPGSWSIANIVADTNPRHTDIGFDSGGNTAISWVDNSTSEIGYAFYDGAAWNTETVTGDAAIRAGVPLLLSGSADEAAIFYSDASTFYASPVFAQRDSAGNWVSDVGLGGTANPFGIAGYMSGMLTGDGHPSICYMDTWNGEIVYAEFDGSDWQSESVVNVGVPTSVPDRNWVDAARDDWGNVHLLYYNQESAQVEYRFRHAEGWWSDARGIGQNASSWMRLAIADDQSPWFAYYSNEDENLYYGQGNPVPEPATTALFAIGLLTAIGAARRNRKTAGREQS